jgi:hypothetical protein
MTNPLATGFRRVVWVLACCALFVYCAACKHATQPPGNTPDTTKTVDTTHKVDTTHQVDTTHKTDTTHVDSTHGLAWMMPQHGATFTFATEYYDSLGQGPNGGPWTVLDEDRFTFDRAGAFDTVARSWRFVHQYGQVYHLAPLANGDVLDGDSIYCGYDWRYYRGADVETGAVNDATTTVTPWHTWMDHASTLTDQTVHTSYGVENVTVPAGTFRALRTQNSSFTIWKDPPNYVPDTFWTVNTKWFVPSIGCYAKSEYYAVEKDTANHERMLRRFLLKDYKR